MGKILTKGKMQQYHNVQSRILASTCCDVKYSILFQFLFFYMQISYLQFLLGRMGH